MNVHDIGSDFNPDRVAAPSENRHVSAEKKPASRSHSSSSSQCTLVSSMPESSRSSDDDPATPIFRTLAAEQPIEGFARTTGSPRDWSMRSNESLFSLYTGNMTFASEQLTWMSKSGEFYYGYDSAVCSPLLPDTPWNNMSATEIAKQGGNLSLNSESSLFVIGMENMSFPSDQKIVGFDPTHSAQFPDTPRNNQRSTGIDEGSDGENEAEASDTKREKKSQIRRGKVHKELSLSYNVPRYSDAIESEDHKGDVRQEPPDSSAKSFAFPILTGYASRNGSLSIEKQNRQSQCSTPETPQRHKLQTPETPKLWCPKETPESPLGTSKPRTPKATRNGGSRK